MHELIPEQLVAKQNFLSDMDRLRADEAVAKLTVRHDKVKVLYADGLSESYNREELESIERFKRDIPIGCQYTINPLDPEYKSTKNFFSVNIKDYKKGAFLDKELLIHRLSKRFKDETFFTRRYPFKLLKADFISIDDSVFLEDDKVVMYPINKKRYRGRFIQESFYDFGNDRSTDRKSIDWVWVRPRITTRIIRMLLASGRNINYTNLVRKFIAVTNNARCARRVRSAGFYIALWKRMGIKEYSWIHDLDPVWWSKALACSKMKLSYTYEDHKYDSVSEQYNEFLDSMDSVGNTSYCDDDIKADVLMLDFNLDPIELDLDKYKQHLGTKWKKIVYVSKEPADDYVEIKTISFMNFRLYFNIIS